MEVVSGSPRVQNFRSVVRFGLYHLMRFGLTIWTCVVCVCVCVFVCLGSLDRQVRNLQLASWLEHINRSLPRGLYFPHAHKALTPHYGILRMVSDECRCLSSRDKVCPNTHSYTHTHTYTHSRAHTHTYTHSHTQAYCAWCRCLSSRDKVRSIMRTCTRVHTLARTPSDRHRVPLCRPREPAL